MIEIHHLTKIFDDKVAVDDLTLTVEQGKLLAFLGPNGAGKTTTIKMLVGLLKPTSGTLKICGYDLEADYLQAKQRVCYIPDQPYLYEKLTGREFMRFVGMLYGMNKNGLDDEIDKWISIFEMSDYIDGLTENYSHGMKQRVVMSSALLHNPEVIIIDEPMVGLDPKSSHLVKRILKERTRNGVTVFMSTHTLSVAEEMADDICIVNRGKLIAQGDLARIRKLSNTQGDLEKIFLTLTQQSDNNE